MTARLRNSLLSAALFAVLAASQGCALFIRDSQLRHERTLSLSLELGAASPCDPVQLRYDKKLVSSGAYSAHEGGHLRVELPSEYAEAGEAFARALDGAIEDAWTRHGIALEQRPVIQFFPVACWPAPIDVRARWRLPHKSPDLPIPLAMIPAGAVASEQVAGISLVNQTVFTIVHELVEFSLATGAQGTLLTDTRSFFGRIKKQHNTRWFRDGVGSLVASEVCLALGLPPYCYRKEGEMALALAGPSILEWSQGESGPVVVAETPVSAALTVDNYAASLELAARIADAAGGLRPVMDEIRKFDYVDGARLAIAVQRATGKQPADFIPAPVATSAAASDPAGANAP